MKRPSRELRHLEYRTIDVHVDIQQNYRKLKKNKRIGIKYYNIYSHCNKKKSN